MTRVAIKGCCAARLRALLTSLAVVLGVAMISGTFVLTDTIQKAFTNVFDTAYDKTSVIITGKEVVKESSTHPTVPASLLERVRSQPGVAAAARRLGDTVRLIGRDGKALGGSDGEGLGLRHRPGPAALQPDHAHSGAWAKGPDQIVIDTGTAKEHHYQVGDSIAAKADGPLRRFTITGTGKLGGGHRSAPSPSPPSTSRPRRPSSTSKGDSTRSTWPPRRASRRPSSPAG